MAPTEGGRQALNGGGAAAEVPQVSAVGWSWEICHCFTQWNLKDRWLHTYIRQSNFSLIFFLCGKIFHNDNDSVAHSGNIADLNDEKSTKRLLQTIRLYRPTSVFFCLIYLVFLYLRFAGVVFISVCVWLSFRVCKHDIERFDKSLLKRIHTIVNNLVKNWHYTVFGTQG